MFHNNMWPYTQRDKSKPKKLKLRGKEVVSKHSRNTKSQKKYKHSKLKCLDDVSKYVGPERLTNHVGFFTKGKISDSISRIEKIMPKEVKARAQQDLQEVLKLTSAKKKRRKRRSRRNINRSCESTSSDEQFLRSSFESPPNLCHKNRFANNSWKDKLQKSVGATSVNSVLASVHEPQKTPPVKELQLIARNVILTKINPFIKESNSLLFPGISNKDKIKRKLQQIKSELVPCTTVNSQETSSISKSSAVSTNAKTRISQTPLNIDFHLSPIFTGEDIDQGGITKIFPNANEFVNEVDNLITDTDSVNLPNKIFDYELNSCHALSSSIGQESSMTFVPTSPATSNDSPAWKLQLSPEKFVPQLGSTPTLYFRRKMF